MSLHTFQLEKDFQTFVLGMLAHDKWHTHPMPEDTRHPGLPDISAARMDLGEWWMELKCGSRMLSVHDRMSLKHPLTAQQKWWLGRRQSSLPEFARNRCGVLVSFCTGPDNGPQDYVSWVPIGMWDMCLNDRRIMDWCMSPYTAQLHWLRRKECSLEHMLRGTLTPGWAGAESGAPSSRSGVTVRS